MASNLSCNKFHNNMWFQKIPIPALRRVPVTDNSKVKGGLTWNTILKRIVWYKAAVQIKKIYYWMGMDIFWDNKKRIKEPDSA